MPVRGALIYADPSGLRGPTVIPFQYNAAELTRTFRVERAAASGSGESPFAARQRPVEEYSLSLELDATDALVRGPAAPVTQAAGLTPTLAALELLMQPVPASDLARAGAERSPVAASQIPTVLFVWSPSRIVPVEVTALHIRETEFDALLNPVRATADITLAVIRSGDPATGQDDVARAARFYEDVRHQEAVEQPAQAMEVGAS